MHGRGGCLLKVVGAVAPADHHGVDAVLGRAFDVVRPVADHEYAAGKRLQLRQSVRHDFRFGGSPPVEAGTGDHFEVLVEAEVFEDPARRRFCFRGRHGEANARGLQVGQQRVDSVVKPVHRPAAGCVVGAIGGDGLVGFVSQPQVGECEVHGWPDAEADQVARGNLGADCCEGVTETGHDALGRVGEGAVQIEDDQLGARHARHLAIVADAEAPVVTGDPNLRDLVASTTVLGVVMEQAGRSTLPRALRYHGDLAAEPGMLDFAVNLRHDQTPNWLVRRLSERLNDLAHYPSSDDERAAVRAVALRHGLPESHVLLLAGGAEGFALLPALRPRLVALVGPSFTEPDAVMAATGIDVRHVTLEPPFRLHGATVPDEADLVVVGNPTNPTGVLHSRDAILALRRPGRIIVVDEAFADSVAGEPESLARMGLSDVLVLRSLTKTWSLAGLRIGYLLGDPGVLTRLSSHRPHWPLGTLQLEAIAACCEPDAVAAAEAEAERLAVIRSAMVTALEGLGVDVVAGSAPFVLFAVKDAPLLRKQLHARGIAVRRCDTFVGLGANHLRVAVRPEWPVLVDAIAEVLR